MLRAEAVSVAFGGVRALDDVSIEVPAGAVTGLIGPNGAGKTTLFNVISGLQRPNHGHVVLNDRDVTRMAPRRRAHLGVARTFQRLETFGSMTALDNVLVAAELHRGWSGRGEDPRALARQIIERLGLQAVEKVQADTLPTGLARLLELGRALATEPSVLLLDEPSAGLNNAETDTLGDLLVDLSETGIAILLVEHDVELVTRISKHVWVLDFGRIIANGTPATVQSDPAVRLAYLGPETEVHPKPGAKARADESDAAAIPARPADPTESQPSPALELHDIEAGYGTIKVLRGVNLTVPAASVVALLGPNGAGKSTTLKVASGRLHASAGVVMCSGRDVTKMAPERLSRSGLCTIPEGRGVFPNLTVAENLQMWTYRGDLRRRDVEERAYTRFPVLAQRRRQLAGTLSGGEQQILAMSRALSTEPKLLLLDEISMGLAPLIVAQLYESVARLATEGIAILVVEQSARTALSVADHAAIMTNGQVVLSGRPDQVADSVLDVYFGMGQGEQATS
jgi:branched-chain amino acid transport system ATP-binding protein